MKLYLLLATQATLSVLCSWASKYWAEGRGFKWGVVAYVFCQLAMLAWMWVLRSGDSQLARMCIMVDVANMLAISVVGLFLIGETMTVQQFVGVGFAFAALVLLS